MKRSIAIASLAAIAFVAQLVSGCVTEPTPTNERLSQESIGSATVGKKPGASERARHYLMR